MTSAAAGRLTEEPTSTMRSSSTRTSPGETIFPDSISRRRAACNTAACFDPAGRDCAKPGEKRTQESNAKDNGARRADFVFIVPKMIALPLLSPAQSRGMKWRRTGGVTRGDQLATVESLGDGTVRARLGVYSASGRRAGGDAEDSS